VKHGELGGAEKESARERSLERGRKERKEGKGRGRNQPASRVPVQQKERVRRPAVLVGLSFCASTPDTIGRTSQLRMTMVREITFNYLSFVSPLPLSPPSFLPFLLSYPEDR
jgi:hypothetical protein